MSEASDRGDRIRDVIRQHGRLPADTRTLDDHTDLYKVGLTSHASVNLMLALESEFDVEFPDAMLKRSVFQSVASIRDALDTLGRAAG